MYLQAYGTEQADNGRKRIKVDFFVMKEKRLYMGVPAAYLFPDTEPVAITASIPLRKCTPGNYVLRVRVTDELTGDVVERNAEFEVREPAR